MIYFNVDRALAARIMIWLASCRYRKMRRAVAAARRIA